MALEKIKFNIASFNDADAGGNNYYAAIVYEIFNSNDTLADIYSDAAGASPINQDGISNVSNSSGECIFYINSGIYYIKVSTKVENFTTTQLESSESKYNPKTLQDAVNNVNLDESGGESLNIKEYILGGGDGAMWDTVEGQLLPITDGVVNHSSLNIQLVRRNKWGAENLKGYEVVDYNFDKPYRMESDYELIAGTTFGIAHTGQSLALGGVGGDSVSGVNTPSFPDRALMFSPQPVASSTNTNSDVPIDLVEAASVTIGHSLTRGLATDNENTVLFSGQGWGGKAYSDLRKGGSTGVFEKVIQQVSNAKDSYDDIVYLGVTCIHGEQDGLNNNTSYEANLNTWRNDFNTDIKATTGQTEDIIMYTCQTATGGGYGFNGGINELTFPTPLSQLSAHVNNTNIVMPCSKYHLPYFDHSHITNLAQRMLGEYYLKAMKVGAAYNPLRPDTFTVNSDNIVIDFVGGVGNLTIDTSIVQAITDSGFSYTDDSSRTITGVAITGAAQVTISLSGAVGTNAVVAYAYHNGSGGQANQKAGLGDRGNLRDSDTVISLYDSTPLYNWCVIFREELN